MGKFNRTIMKSAAIALLIVPISSQVHTREKASTNVREFHPGDIAGCPQQIQPFGNHPNIRDCLQNIQKAANDDLLKRAQKSDPEAQKELASAYEHGRDGFEQNDTLAIYWYEKAAAHGDTWAIASVALLLLTGELDTSAEDAKAATLEWMQNHSDKAIVWRLSVSPQNLTTEDINAIRLRKRFHRATLAAGCDIYPDGSCTPEIRRSGILTIKSLAEAGLPEAQTLWGMTLFRKDMMYAIGLEPDPQDGLAYLLKGAEGGDPKAFVEIASVYEHGKGVESDTHKALEWYDGYVQLTTKLKKDAETKGHVTSFEDKLLVQCKLYFLRGDAIAPVTQYECESNRHFIQAY